MKPVQSAREKEWKRLLKQERLFLYHGAVKKETKLNQILADKVPPKLQTTLDAAFSKAFETVFEKGTGVIEKTYNKEEIAHRFKVNTYSADLAENRKTLRQFSKESANRSRKNVLLTGLEGVGLGALGIGIPDIPVFVGVMLKGIYEIALNFGYGYESREEKYFILKLIETALSHGSQLNGGNTAVNEYIVTGEIPESYDQTRQIRTTAETMSTELLYLKFLQGIPLVGVVGGASNSVYLQKVLKYAKLKYHQRFLSDGEQGTENQD